MGVFRPTVDILILVVIFLTGWALLQPDEFRKKTCLMFGGMVCHSCLQPVAMIKNEFGPQYELKRKLFYGRIDNDGIRRRIVRP